LAGRIVLIVLVAALIRIFIAGLILIPPAVVGRLVRVTIPVRTPALSGRAALIRVFIAGPILIPPAVVGRLVQVTILVRAAGAATRRRLVAASTCCTTLATAADIDTELGHGLAVDLAGDFKPIAPLKLRERVAGLRSQSAVDLEHEAFFDKDHLNLADFLYTETAGSRRPATRATPI